MIIFGYKTHSKVIGQAEYKCSYCKHKRKHAIARQTYWFSLFFIPILPFKSKLFSVCSHCRFQTEISDNDRKKIEEALNRLR